MPASQLSVYSLRNCSYIYKWNNCHFSFQISNSHSPSIYTTGPTTTSDVMSFSFQGPPPSTSSPGRDNDNPSTNFNVELGSFLVSLSRTADNDMSSLEQQLARLKVAWREEVRKTGGESGEGKNALRNVLIGLL